MERGDYDSVATASLPIDRFEQHYVRAILDVYHNSPHEGLSGETPHNAWVRQTQLHKVRPLIEPDVMRHIFGMEFTRKLDGDGLRFLGVSYHSPILANMLIHLGQIDVPIRVNRADMTSISFQKDGMWYVADNTIGLAPGISVGEWLDVSKTVTTKFKETTAMTLDIMYTALAELRESGTAAALRNPLGLRDITRDEVEKAERALMHRGGFLVKKAPESLLALEAPTMRAGAFIGESALGFDNLVNDVAIQDAAERVKNGKPTKAGTKKSKKSSGSHLGGADDIQL